jgi:Protein of unknown function (DUF2281)
MTTTEAIVQRLKSLPASAQREVLDFVEFLQSRRQEHTAREDEVAWSAFSLASAMRGMEEEETPYTLADVKEAFR